MTESTDQITDTLIDTASKAGNWGWAALVAGVVAWDVLAEETLSDAVDRYLEHPMGKFAAIGTVAITGAHLLNVFEKVGAEKYDPIAKLGDVLGMIKHGKAQG